eukprot:COSAG04_NODE_5681_length_1530_cov_1.858141_2_plen_148_part_01
MVCARAHPQIRATTRAVGVKMDTHILAAKYDPVLHIGKQGIVVPGRLPTIVERHPCVCSVVPVEPVDVGAVQNSATLGAGVSSHRADGELRVDDAAPRKGGAGEAGNVADVAGGPVPGAHRSLDHAHGHPAVVAVPARVRPDLLARIP